MQRSSDTERAITSDGCRSWVAHIIPLPLCQDHATSQIQIALELTTPTRNCCGRPQEETVSPHYL